MSRLGNISSSKISQRNFKAQVSSQSSLDTIAKNSDSVYSSFTQHHYIPANPWNRKRKVYIPNLVPINTPQRISMNKKVHTGKLKVNENADRNERFSAIARGQIIICNAVDRL